MMVISFIFIFSNQKSSDLKKIFISQDSKSNNKKRKFDSNEEKSGKEFKVKFEKSSQKLKPAKFFRLSKNKVNNKSK